jgi:hypothetical protein
MPDDHATPKFEPSTRSRPLTRTRGHPWLAFTLGSGLPAALAAAHAPWLVVAVVGLLGQIVIGAIHVFLEGAVPAREWAAAREAWRVTPEKAHEVWEP